ncbi:hypothetical protein [Parapedobacter sp.]|uniref:hypothetical protein n=1 Tax=Parapedobacter sp. TaxID=1958893 RepID=UPI002D7FFC43|nr:hypothetical protein [Parapedobacter sp.]
MELIVKSNNEQSIAKIIALARKLKVSVERKTTSVDESRADALKDRILNFKATNKSQFGDAAEWERREREDRDLPLLCV